MQCRFARGGGGSTLEYGHKLAKLFVTLRQMTAIPACKDNTYVKKLQAGRRDVAIGQGVIVRGQERLELDLKRIGYEYDTNRQTAPQHHSTTAPQHHN